MLWRWPCRGEVNIGCIGQRFPEGRHILLFATTLFPLTVLTSSLVSSLIFVAPAACTDRHRIHSTLTATLGGNTALGGGYVR